MSNLNEVVKNFLFAASLRADDALISKVVSAKRLLFIGIGSEVDHYMYSMAAISEIVCKELFMAVDRQRLIEASASSTILGKSSNNSFTSSSNSNNKAKKFNAKEYVQKLYLYRTVLKKVLTMEKLFTLLHNSHHVVPAALVEHAQQSLATLFDLLDSKCPHASQIASGGKKCRSKEEEQVWASLSRAEYFCAGIFCEAKRRPEYASLLKLEKLTEVAEIQLDTFKTVVKVLQPILLEMVYEDKSNDPTNGSSLAANAAGQLAGKKKLKSINTGEVLDFDEPDSEDDESKDQQRDTKPNSVTSDSQDTISAAAPAASTLGKRNLQAFLQHDRRRHLAELAYQQQQEHQTRKSDLRSDAQLQNKLQEDERRQRELVETQQQFRLLYELWRDQFS